MSISISITNVRPATIDEWDATWQQCDYATYFHSREWAEIWNAYTQGKMYPEPKLIVFSDEKKVILPISSQRIFKGLVKTYHLSPAGTFGGWISSDKLNCKHTSLLIDYLINTFGNFSWRINPYNKLESNASTIETQDDETHAIKLTGGFENIKKKWTTRHKSTARKVRKAQKEGVSIKMASTLDDWLNYYQVYQQSLKRWGNKATSKYEWKLFDNIYQLNSPDINLWLAIYQDSIIAGAVCFYAKQHVVYWHGAALSDYFHLRPVNLLMYEVIKNACAGGYSWFDFNPSGGHEGVKAFKKSFGAEALPCPIVNTQDFITTFLNGVNSKLRLKKIL